MSLTMVHANPLRIERGILTVDRKFHLGMLNYAQRITCPITSIHPLPKPDQLIMDAVDVPVADLPYRVLPVRLGKDHRLLRSELHRVRNQIAGSHLVYGAGLGSESVCRQLDIPYIMVLEYDLQTMITIATCEVTNPVKKAVRIARSAYRHANDILINVRHAHSVHCNGFPMYAAVQRHNRNRLLYFDSRMSADMILSPEALAARLCSRAGRKTRLLYSGRYERLKGADDAVRVAAECLRLGLPVEMHCYGQGTLRNEMLSIAAQFPGRIFIHNAVPYPELARISQSFDMFVCCHIQNDPSCTYLESFGAGLPVIGYANRMWSRLCEISGAGMSSPVGSPKQVANCVGSLLSDEAALRKASERALQFANDHCFEIEFTKRVDAIMTALRRLQH